MRPAFNRRAKALAAENREHDEIDEKELRESGYIRAQWRDSVAILLYDRSQTGFSSRPGEWGKLTPYEGRRSFRGREPQERQPREKVEAMKKPGEGARVPWRSIALGRRQTPE